jgi:hypothetical protein
MSGMLTLASRVRWTGIRVALDNFLKQRRPVTDVIHEAKLRSGKKSILPRKCKIASIELTPKQWQEATELHASLTAAHQATIILQAEKEATSPIMLEHLLTIMLEFEKDMLAVKTTRRSGPSEYALVEEADLCESIRNFRATVRGELKQRFPLDSTIPSVRTKLATRFGLPAYLHPHHRDMDEAPETFVAETEKILKERMRAVAQPLRERLKELYDAA